MFDLKKACCKLGNTQATSFFTEILFFWDGHQEFCKNDEKRH